MSSVRPMAAGDAAGVAGLYLRILRRRQEPPSAALVGTIRSFYCDGPFRQPDLPSLVHVAADGRVTGFVGVNAVPMLLRGRPIRAAFCGSLMVENHQAAPLAGATLMKTFLSGPQDVSFSETANGVAQGMWERLRGEVLPGYSLEWVRILRPAGFALAMASRRRGFLAPLSPLARAADRLLQRRSPKSSLARFVPDPTSGALAAEEIGPDAFAALMERLTEKFAARPDWSGGYAGHVLAEALEKPEFGTPVLAAAGARGAAPVGAFLYHVKPGGIARVLQVFAAPGRAGAVMQCLFADALARGAVGLRGRTQPALLQAAMGRSVAFATVASTVVHARDPALAEVFRTGGGFVNGLAGETWCRLFGGGLD